MRHVYQLMGKKLCELPANLEPLEVGFVKVDTAEEGLACAHCKIVLGAAHEAIKEAK